MRVLDQNALQKMIDDLAGRIGATGPSLAKIGTPNDFAFPYVLIDNRGYHFIVNERGDVLKRQTTTDVDELLYWIFQSATSHMANEYVAKNRQPGQDYRRIMFAYQLQLLEALNPEWRQRRQAEIAKILDKHPYTGSQ